MALTIQSKVFANRLNDEMKEKLRLMRYVDDIGELNNGVHAGDTITIMGVKEVSEPVVLERGSAIDLEEVSDEIKAETKIEHFAKGITNYDEDKITKVNGKYAFDEKVTSLGKQFQKTQEKSLKEKMLKNNLKFKIAENGKITANEINSAITTAWGDNQDVADFYGIVIPSVLSGQFYAMGEFVDINKTYNGGKDGVNGIVKNGTIGYFRGIEVMMDDLACVDGNEYVIWIVKKGALGRKQLPVNGEAVRNAEYKRDDYFADQFFATIVKDGTKLLAMRYTIATTYTTDVTGDGSTKTFTIEHNLNTANVSVVVKGSDGNAVDVTVNKVDDNNSTIEFATAPSSGTKYTVSVARI